MYPFLDQTIETKLSKQQLLECIPLIKERLETLRDVNTHLLPLCRAPEKFNMEDFVFKKMTPEESYKTSILGLECMEKVVKTYWEHNPEQLEIQVRTAAQDMGLKLVQVLMPFRIAVVGRKTSPPILPYTKLLSLEEVIQRIQFAIKKLQDII